LFDLAIPLLHVLSKEVAQLGALGDPSPANFLGRDSSRFAEVESFSLANAKLTANSLRTPNQFYWVGYPFGKSVDKCILRNTFGINIS